MTDADLLKEIDAQRLLMISVSTGQASIDSKNDEYIERRERISVALRERGLADPNEYDDLWAWYGKWSSGDLPKWQQRREFVTALYKPLTESVSAGPAALLPEPTGWPKVDSMRRTIAVRVAQAKSEHDYQGVGHLCRETLIALADAVYDPVRHRSADGSVPSKADAEERLNAYLSVELRGAAHEQARRAVKAVLVFANAVQHDQGATLRDAALVAEATNGIINLIAIIGGHRDKPLESIRVELAERLARVEAEAVSWKEKYEAMAGFSARATLQGDIPGETFVRVVATQDIEVNDLEYCAASGVKFASQAFTGIRGRDVRVAVAYSHLQTTFQRAFPGRGEHVVDILLRVNFRVGDVMRHEEIRAQLRQDVGSGQVKIYG